MLSGHSVTHDIVVILISDIIDAICRNCLYFMIAVLFVWHLILTTLPINISMLYLNQYNIDLNLLIVMLRSTDISKYLFYLDLLQMKCDTCWLLPMLSENLVNHWQLIVSVWRPICWQPFFVKAFSNCNNCIQHNPS